MKKKTPGAGYGDVKDGGTAGPCTRGQGRRITQASRSPYLLTEAILFSLKSVGNVWYLHFFKMDRLVFKIFIWLLLNLLQYEGSFVKMLGLSWLHTPCSMGS